MLITESDEFSHVHHVEILFHSEGNWLLVLKGVKLVDKAQRVMESLEYICHVWCLQKLIYLCSFNFFLLDVFVMFFAVFVHLFSDSLFKLLFFYLELLFGLFKSFPCLHLLLEFFLKFIFMGLHEFLSFLFLFLLLLFKFSLMLFLLG